MTISTRPQKPSDAVEREQTKYRSGIKRAFTPVYTFGASRPSATTCYAAPGSERMWSPKGRSSRIK